MRARLPSLDGLRAVSIGMVVACHAAKVLGASGVRLPALGLLRDWGPLGVTVFFVISGFLITSLLLEEQQSRGEIRLGAFYGRRAFRILPAYWTFLAGVAVLTALGRVENSSAAFARAFTFTSNYLPTHSWSLGHSWSLSVEEQFYLFWPALLVALGPRRARPVAVALIALAPLARLATWAWLPEWRGAIGNMLHTRVDALMVGCLAALLRFDGAPVLGWTRRHGAASLAAGFLFFGATAARHAFGPLYPLALGNGLEALSACVLVLWGLEHERTAVGRVLNLPAVAWVGSLSYSLYLWQEPLLDPHAGLPASALPLRILLALGVAWASYRWIEKPFLALRTRLGIGAEPRPAASVAPAVAR